MTTAASTTATLEQRQRHWLATAIAHPSALTLHDAPFATAADAAQCAYDEGIDGLLHQSLSAVDAWPQLVDLLTPMVRDAAALSLVHRGQLVRIITCLHDAGIRTLLLKGSALAWWLHAQPYLRPVVDVDLLVASPAEARRAAHALATLGYAAAYDAGRGGYEKVLKRADGAQALEIDLHHALVNVPLFAHILRFDMVWAQSQVLARLGTHARGLGAAHALVHACLHRAANLGLGNHEQLKWAWDIHALTKQLDERSWMLLLDEISPVASAVMVEGITDAEGYFGAALDAGMRARLQISALESGLDAAALRDWSIMQRRNFSSLPPLQRWLWLRDRILPSAAYMRANYGDLSYPQLLLMRTRRAWLRLRGG